MSQPFDFDKALKALQSGQALTGKDGDLNSINQTVNRSCIGC
ncbi:Transposase for insertion sequence element ISRM3 [Salmonella enterica subsp. arizonae]|nr:Transposase for insertion sequence element ISRM3 [Salmonella enterica subsp. arizonae]